MTDTATASANEPSAKRVEPGRGADWWREGWRLFAASPGTWIAIVVTWLLIPAALQLAHTIGYFASQFVGPILTAGLLICARDQDRGAPLTFERLFAGFKGGLLKPLLMLGLINFGLTLAVLACALLAAVGVLGTDVVMSLLSSDSPDVASLDLFSIVVALLVATPILLIGFFLTSMAFWFAPGLIVVNGMQPWRAMVLSFRTNLTNIGAIVVFDLIGLGYSLLALLTLGLGLFVLGPMMACGWYATWRDVFGENPPAAKP